MRLIDKEQHTIEEKQKAEEDEIRKVESERPLEGENQVPDFWKEKGCHPNENGRNQLTSQWQVEGSGSKSESLNEANHS